MKRTEFIKLSSLSLVGLATGLTYPPLSIFVSNDDYNTPFVLDMPDVHEEIVIDKSDALWIGWLARLVVSSLVTSLGAKLVDRALSSSSCNGSTCSSNKVSPSSYVNQQGIYGYDSPDRRFMTQQIKGQNLAFDNVSVPFLSNRNTPITHVEGPFLAGICQATGSLTSRYTVQQVRRLIVPKSEISNGGSRFDVSSCHPTKFKTDYGSTEVRYNPKDWGGNVQVLVRDEYDNLNWKGNYDLRV